MPTQWEYQLDEHITPPQSYFGFPVGSQHTDWSQAVSYLRLLASQSERLVLDTLGHTYEHRPIVCLRITSPRNQRDIERIRLAHLLEQTVMKQSARLIRLNEESDGHARPLHRKDLITLEADDLAVESVTNYRVEKVQIGFH